VGVVYLGTSDFAAGVLEALAEGPHKPTLVITRPDAKQGRGRKIGPPPVAVAARELGIETIQPVSVNDEETSARVAAGKPDAVVLCAFGALVKAPLLTDHDILNVHPSLLPRWRGAAPVERAMMAGDAQTGVSIMRLVAELDAGPVYAQQPADPADRRLRLALGAAPRRLGQAAGARPGDRPDAGAPARGRRHLRREANC
jgi:methionyl-tRNA formyltransferase